MGYSICIYGTPMKIEYSRPLTHQIAFSRLPCQINTLLRTHPYKKGILETSSYKTVFGTFMEKTYFFQQNLTRFEHCIAKMDVTGCFAEII